ncbi:hypothetical protein DL93DRAFT_263136 [Clavulina sp. PMI_390]|nr:hypothetical protein DL93DRAFT_263136 [Clavulina sp. PMI_390]
MYERAKAAAQFGSKGSRIYASTYTNTPPKALSTMSEPVVLEDEMQLDDESVRTYENTVEDGIDDDEEIDELADDDELMDDLGAQGAAEVEPDAGEASGTPATTNGASGDVSKSATKPPAAKKPPRKPASERTPGSSLIASSRVAKIMKADKDLGITAKEAVFLVSIATEEFIKRLAFEGHKVATREGRSVVTQRDLAAAVKRTDELLFLKEIIPLPVSATEAMSKRQARADGTEIEDIAAGIASKHSPNSDSTFPTTKNGSSSSLGTAVAPTIPAAAGSLDAFVDRKPSARKTRASRGGAAVQAADTAGPSSNGGDSSAANGLANGQHTFPAVDPNALERDRHPSYYGDFTIAPTPIPSGMTSGGSGASTMSPPSNVPTPSTRSSGRTSLPTTKRAQAQAQEAAQDEAMDTT